MSNPYKFKLRAIILQTGETKDYEEREYRSPYHYFSVVEKLNKEAVVYGIVYVMHPKFVDFVCRNWRTGDNSNE